MCPGPFFYQGTIVTPATESLYVGVSELLHCSLTVLTHGKLFKLLFYNNCILNFNLKFDKYPAHRAVTVATITYNTPA